MFSEYASRFLAQSQSRLSFGQPPEEQQQQPPFTRDPTQRARRQDQRASRFQSTRSYLQRPTLGNPYQAGSTIANFPFASRASNAPLFYSAHDQLREDEDDEEEREREVADFYALQRSRRQFGDIRLDDSSEADEASEGGSDTQPAGGSRGHDDRAFFDRRDIRSSWRGGDKRRKKAPPSSPPRSPNPSEQGAAPSVTSSRAPLEDVGLESVLPGHGAASEADQDEPPDDLAIEVQPEENPPSAQQFRNPPLPKAAFIPTETPTSQRLDRPPIPSDSMISQSPPPVSNPADAAPRHDVFWGTLYLISLAALFASFALVWLHTSAPSLKKPIGDTIYSTIHGSYHLLAVDTLVAVIVSLVWLSLLKSYVRALVYTILVVVPIILFSFFLYPLIASYQGSYHGASIQDKAMRGFAIIPGLLSVLWAFAVYKGRHSLGKSVSILEFSCKILLANPGLSVLGFVSLGSVIVWTWLWMGMFTRVFLGGHLSSGARFFIIDTSTWWLGIFFVLVYLWTLGVLSGIQRATTAATVSQWYFHRLSVPTPSSRAVLTAALTHSLTTLFGTISLASLLALLIRLPYLILPRRALALAGLCSYTVLPSTIATLTNPLTLTYSAIHSQPLVASSRALARLSFLAPPSSSSRRRHNHLSSAPFHARNTPSQTPLHSYTLALLLLRATRFITSLALGFGGWVSTARSLTLASASRDGGGGTPSIKGSLYAYVVGLIAAAIGWGVLGAIDGVVAGVVDALVVCWGSEVGRSGVSSTVRYCREADELFGQRHGDMGMGDDDEESAAFLHGRRRG